MDASLQSFIKYRVDRLEEISLDLFGESKENLIPQFCNDLRKFCLNRPKSRFFNTAKGTRLIRKDLKYFFPAVFGIDIRAFTQGPELEFSLKRYQKARKQFAPARDFICAFARLMFEPSRSRFFSTDIGANWPVSYASCVLPCTKVFESTNELVRLP